VTKIIIDNNALDQVSYFISLVSDTTYILDRTCNKECKQYDRRK